MNEKHILIIEDDEDIQQLVSFNLIKVGFHVSCTDNGETGLGFLQSQDFDALILDLMLPGMSGYDVCKTLRKDAIRGNLPVIMLTAKGEEDDIVTGLENGADDYITKPFSPKVLVARVKSALRRGKTGGEDNSASQVISLHDLNIDKGRHEVLLAGKKMTLTRTEFQILVLLAERPGWVFSRQQIIDQLRGYDYCITPRAIDVQVFGLRKKLGQAGKNIETVRGFGYRFRD